MKSFKYSLFLGVASALVLSSTLAADPGVLPGQTTVAAGVIPKPLSKKAKKRSTKLQAINSARLSAGFHVVQDDNSVDTQAAPVQDAAVESVAQSTAEPVLTQVAPAEIPAQQTAEVAPQSTVPVDHVAEAADLLGIQPKADPVDVPAETVAQAPTELVELPQTVPAETMAQASADPVAEVHETAPADLLGLQHQTALEAPAELAAPHVEEVAPVPPAPVDIPNAPPPTPEAVDEAHAAIVAQLNADKHEEAATAGGDVLALAPVDAADGMSPDMAAPIQIAPTKKAKRSKKRITTEEQEAVIAQRAARGQATTEDNFAASSPFDDSFGAPAATGVDETAVSTAKKKTRKPRSAAAKAKRLDNRRAKSAARKAGRPSRDERIAAGSAKKADREARRQAALAGEDEFVAPSLFDDEAVSGEHLAAVAPTEMSEQTAPATSASSLNTQKPMSVLIYSETADGKPAVDVEKTRTNSVNMLDQGKSAPSTIVHAPPIVEPEHQAAPAPAHDSDEAASAPQHSEADSAPVAANSQEPASQETAEEMAPVAPMPVEDVKPMIVDTNNQQIVAPVSTEAGNPQDAG